ncbi:MAG TPA: RNA polymerase sigma factor [Cytophagales bacterium]|nr:RNA polymerase sigma factor [Cytophagales bacterium]HAA23697.1 RNA polymerase sigma factor [Cytophagales bacterium]HAP62865.1 RNA polymerase sigma factor [Cytophagales bacterium]
MRQQQDFETRFIPVRNKMYRFALRLLGEEQEAEDVVQDVLLKIWKQRHRFEEISNAEAWCMQLTRNLSLDRLKSPRRKLRATLEGWDGAEGGATPDKAAEVNDAMQRMRSLLKGLPEMQQAVLHLREVEGYSYQEMTEVLELDLNQVKVYLHRARKALREQLLAQDRYGLATNRNAG